MVAKILVLLEYVFLNYKIVNIIIHAFLIPKIEYKNGILKTFGIKMVNLKFLPSVGWKNCNLPKNIYVGKMMIL